MRDVELLDLWVRAGRTAGPARAGVLSGASPDASVGAVNRGLLSAWIEDFGERLECVARCPSCGERLEAEVSVPAILAAGGESAAPALDLGGSRVTLRPPTLADLEAAAATGDAAAARLELARRSLGGADVDDELAGAVSAALDAADPHLAVRLALECPACGTPFEAAVDVGAHVWAAVDRRAQGVMTEVADLAAAYGWTEDEVLRLPPARRRAYAERAGR
jgi:hypothetical protein